MYKTGGIIGIIAGIFAVIAAVVTLLFGGLATAFHADKASTVVGLGWGGVLFSFLVIVFGALAFSKPKGAGWGLTISAILGAILGGTLVAIFMVLAFIGGVLAIAGAKTAPQASSTPDAYRPSSHTEKSAKKWPYAVACAIILVGGLAAAGRYAKTDAPAAESIPTAPTAANSNVDNFASISELVHAPITGPEAVMLTDFGASPPEDQVAAFKRLSGTEELTSLQREARAKALNTALSNAKGKTVVWDLVVNNVASSGQSTAGGIYRISTKCAGLENRVIPEAQIQKAHPKTEVLVTARNDDEIKAMQALATCSVVRVKGVVANYDNKGNVELNPAIIVQTGNYKAHDVVISNTQDVAVPAPPIAETLAHTDTPKSTTEAGDKEAALSARSAQQDPVQQENPATLQAADKELNATYVRLMKNLPPEKRTELKRMELDWIRNRDANCGQDIACLTKFTQERTKELATQSR
ncbi:lysozyme inhibitor LprI family protein [Duganella sp. Dugasp56]|uniref:lysozyme inhibitor LprI family protein n=1 Tax=Duganella sp. Dugasp56 TaxID=3243046 RepID=UPI0039AF0A59